MTVKKLYKWKKEDKWSHQSTLSSKSPVGNIMYYLTKIPFYIKVNCCLDEELYFMLVEEPVVNIIG